MFQVKREEMYEVPVCSFKGRELHMARHPNIFLTKRQFEQALIDVGCHTRYADAAASDFSILMPLLIHALGLKNGVLRS